MSFAFKIWDQGSTGDPMAIRVDGVDQLKRLAKTLVGPDVGSMWASLEQYLSESAMAITPPTPFVRMIDILWEGASPTPPSSYCQDRPFRVTYSGWQRKRGGFASQGYAYLDPSWAAALRSCHRQKIEIDVYPGLSRDLFVVRH